MFASRLFFTLTTVHVTALLLAPAYADTLEIHMRINQDVEDIAEQEWGGIHRNGQVQKGDIAIDLGTRNTVGYSDEPVDVSQRIALLFRNIDIPAGSTINSANIQFTVHAGDSTIWIPDNDPEIGTFAPLEAAVSIYGLLDSDPVDLPRLSTCLSNNQCVPSTLYTLTDLTGGQCVGGLCNQGQGPMGGVGSDISNVTAPVHWQDIPTWTTGDVNGNGVADLGDYDDIIGAAGPDQRTPDLSPILQQLTDLAGWAPNHSMVFMIDPMFVEDPNGDYDSDDDRDGHDFLKWQRGDLSVPVNNQNHLMDRAHWLASWEQNYSNLGHLPGEDVFFPGGRDAVSFCTFPAPFPPLCEPQLEPPVLLIDFTPPGAAGAASTAIPEPATGFMLMLCMMVFLLHRHAVVSSSFRQ
ncbi:MAG: hypothetical protein ABGX16_17935 [Pirellulales bacterium]